MSPLLHSILLCTYGGAHTMVAYGGQRITCRSCCFYRVGSEERHQTGLVAGCLTEPSCLPRDTSSALPRGWVFLASEAQHVKVELVVCSCYPSPVLYFCVLRLLPGFAPWGTISVLQVLFPLYFKSDKSKVLPRHLL